MNDQVSVFSDSESLGLAAANRIVSGLTRRLRSRGSVSCVLSGGMTPRLAYKALPETARKAGLDWSNVHLFWGDERLVSPEDPASNYGMARRSLLSEIEIPESNIHRIPGELPSAAALSEYERNIFTHFRIDDGRIPEFDVLLLGLGEDGHVASLFPGTPALEEKERIVVVSRIGKSERISLTLPVINNAREVLALVSGRTKAAILRTVLTDGGPDLPARRVSPRSLSWLVDTDAASLLKGVK
ncbi:MAG: 6-phosphogluconolactonase [Ignavibacteria bacterium]|nr:6-phosphogluconolactonase [Ignavibacteria bacterium]